MSELMREDEILQEEDEQITFIVDDDQKAEWCLGKIREAEAEKAKWKAFYEERLEKICAAEDAKIEHMRFLLEQYFRTVPHKQTKTQESYQLPSGKLVVKQQAPEIKHDDEAIMQWLYENSQAPETYIEIKDSLKWGELKKVLKVAGDAMTTEDGEIIPGITVTERPDVFKVEVK